MATWMIRKEELEDEVYPPKPLFPYWAELFPEQVINIQRKWDCSFLINGAPGTGKTVTAIMRAANLIREGIKCLYIAPTFLSLRYAKHAFSSLGLNERICLSYYEFDKHPVKVDVILLDDSHRYGLEQIQSLASSSQYLSLFGDYSHNSLYETDKAKLNDIVQAIQCQVFAIGPSRVPSSFLRLIPTCSEVMLHSSCQSDLPYIVKCASIEEQCRIIKMIIESRFLEDVGILCYTRELVQLSHNLFASIGFPVEIYLPGKLDGMDTIDLDSDNPKLLTISSSIGIHFKTVFVIGFDKKTIWKNPEETIITIATRPTENFFIFYESHMPDSLSKVPQNLYRSDLIALGAGHYSDSNEIEI